MKHKILISDKFDAEGVSRLQSESTFEVIYQGGHSREELLSVIGEAEGLIIRSATKVDEEVLKKAKNLKLIIRAGVGVDNINIEEASRRGVIVMNAPGGNSVSTAEQALALLFASARKTPQANASMKDNKWEKSKFKGTELTGKTLGVIGLGRIGREVVRRARGLQMKVIGHDPFIPKENLAHLEIEILSRDEVIENADFITVHTPLTETTKDLINLDNYTKTKKGVSLINCARGGIYNEAALEEGLKTGHFASVALDVYTTEPVPEDFPLRNYDNCIMTPHLGASTSDAEFAVAMETIEQMVEFFKSGVARNALNFPTMDPESLVFLKPYFHGGEKVGQLLAHFLEGNFSSVEIQYHGEISQYDTKPVTTGILQGALSLAMGDEVNSVNAPFLAKERKIQVNESRYEKSHDYSSSVKVIFTGSNGQKAELRYSAINGEPLVVSMFSLPIEFRPEGNIIILRNTDKPGVVGAIGMFLGDHGVNIAHLELGRDEQGGTAISVITVDTLLASHDLEKITRVDNILSAVQMHL